MQINELKINKKKNRKRIGRGGRRGTYSGKGMKGQKARSGIKKDLLFEGGQTSLIDRLKKTRGFKSVHPKKNVVNLKDLENKFKSGEEVNLESLVKVGLVTRKNIKNGVKILGDGKLTKKITVGKGILLSKSAKKVIGKSSK